MKAIKMTDAPELAQIARAGGSIEARFARSLPHGREAVWAMLTAEANLPLWLAPGRIELREGGAAKINFADSGTIIDSKVSAYDSGRLIEYSWSAVGEPARPVRWELNDAGDGTRLSLIVRTPAGEDAARAAAGWEAHLDMLEAALEGVPIKFPFERFKAAREAYKARLQDGA